MTKLHLKWNQRSSRGNFHTHTCVTQYTLLTPKEEMGLVYLTGSNAIVLPQQEEGKVSPVSEIVQPVGDHNPINEKSLYFKLSVSSNRTFNFNSFS